MKPNTLLTIWKEYHQLLVLFFGKNLHVVIAFTGKILFRQQPLLTRNIVKFLKVKQNYKPLTNGSFSKSCQTWWNDSLIQRIGWNAMIWIIRLDSNRWSNKTCQKSKQALFSDDVLIVHSLFVHLLSKVFLQAFHSYLPHSCLYYCHFTWIH